MTAMTSQITSLTIVYSIVYSGIDQRKHQSSASLAFVRWIHRGPVNSRPKGQLRRKCFHLMTSSWMMNVYSTRLYSKLPISLSPLVLDINNQRHLSNWMGRFVQVTRASYIATEWMPISRSSFPIRSGFNFRWGTHAIKCFCLALLSRQNDRKRIKTGDVLFSVTHLVYKRVPRPSASN